MSRNLRIHLGYSTNEWKILEACAQEHHFKSARNFIYNRISKCAYALDVDADGDPGAVLRKQIVTFKLKDEEAIHRLTRYAQLHDISVTVLIKRLVTDPVLVARLLEGPPVAPRLFVPGQ